MIISSSSVAATSRYRQFACDGSVRPYPGASPLAASLRQAHPGGVNVILIGVAPSPGHASRYTSKGIIAVLIALLLPVVQRVQQAASHSPEVQALKSALAPGGRIGLAMADGSVMSLYGPSDPQGWGDPHER